MYIAILLSSKDESFISPQLEYMNISELLVSRFLILASQNLNVSTFTTRESSLDDGVETVNLPLSSAGRYKTQIIGHCFTNTETNLNISKSWP